MGEIVGELNRLAGTTGRGAAGAANIWAGTTGLELVGALNAKAGTTGLGHDAACRIARGITDPTVSGQAALSRNSKLVLPGPAGNYASAADSPSFDLSTELDTVFEFPAEQSSTAGTVILTGRRSLASGNFSWGFALLSSGKLYLQISSDGTNITAASSSIALPATIPAGYKGRATWRASDGRTQFFTSTDGTKPTSQLGTDQTLSEPNIYNGSATVNVGQPGGADLEAGSMQLFDSIDGTLIAAPDFTGQAPGATVFTDVVGVEWTVNQSGDPQAEVKAA